ncbi:MAG TPA: T9SS type A sorting domain-containing protein [Candidatus Krumholzibacteria bacterium]|nr:T9SS type A sorting domain-containing protein [Candidatus Krumholzibacteria bacterium]
MRPRLSFALLLILICPVMAHAQWVQDGTPVCTAVAFQSGGGATTDGAGGTIIAWEDYRSGTNYDVYAQRIDAMGNVKWTTDGVVVTNAINHQSHVVIASDGAGGAIIAWQDYRSGSSYDIYAQRVNATGIAQWAPGGVAISTATFDQYFPTMTSDGAGGAILEWTDYRSGAGVGDIYAQRVNGAGVVQWTANGVAVCTASNDQAAGLIAPDGASGAIVAWEDLRGGSSTDIYAQRINSAGVTQWTANGVSVCGAANTQSAITIASDGGGGAAIAWQDYRSGTQFDIYAQRVNSTGTSLWGADGVAVCTEGSNQYYPSLAWDNTTGAILAWGDFRSGTGDIYADRITPGGNLVWTANGVPVCTNVQWQNNAKVIPDGSGGAVIAWGDQRASSAQDIYAQRVDQNGFPRWASDGVAVSTASGAQNTPVTMLTDGSGGAVLTWSDLRDGTYTDIYTQHIDGRYGYWGRPDPVLAAVKDVPADNGGKVRVEWTASQRDQINQQAISHYTIWRAIDQSAYATALAAGVPELKLGDPASKFTGKAIRHEKAQATDYYWELIGEQNAFYRAAYSFTASTSFDSTAANPATHRFQILAHSNNSDLVNWPSNILSGRSVDNVSPPAPLFLTALRNGTGSNVSLKWNGVHVKDLDKYTVYRASSTGVTPIQANFLANNNDTLLVDAGAPPTALYYIVTASDIHQNQGTKSNEASVAAATGVGNTPAITALTVLQNHPNPFTGETQLSVGLPARGDIRVAIYDVTGRRVRSVLVPAQEKGWDTLRISARDDRGAPLPSGVYFYRVHAGNETVTKKMVIAR